MIFELANVVWIHIKNTNTFEVGIRYIMRYAAVFLVWKKCINKYHLNFYHHNLRVDKDEILAKDLTSGIDSGYNDVAHIQNNLLYICLFTDFDGWKAN